MAHSPDHLRYHAYILRLWQERPATTDQSSVWRFSLEDTHTRQRRGFADLDKVLNFLQTQVGDSGAGRVERGGWSVEPHHSLTR